jgi:hypothetical protein
MENAPYAERLDFWRWQQASVAFEQVRNLCDFILKEKVEQPHPLHIPLMTALHALYARPFKQRKEVRLGGDIVPAAFKDVHDSLITMRDKIHAHTDIDGPMTANDESFNKVAAFVRNGGIQFASTVVFPRHNHVERIRDLAEILSQKASYSAKKIWTRCIGSSRVMDGDYEVNLSKHDDAFLKPLSW